MTAYEIDPLSDPRWERLTQTHPHASVFHSPAWLRALHRAYGYQPLALTTTPPQRELENGVVFCRVASRLTGHRLVSLPFSDHCEPLVADQREFDCILAHLRENTPGKETRYIEIRPLTSRFAGQAGFAPLEEFRLHRICLTSPADAMFQRFHKNIRRNIRRGENGLRYEEGSCGSLLDPFRRLLTLTRRRHFLPPQPLAWFRGLLDYMGDRAVIRLAYKDEIPVAGILTLRHNGVMVYKYGGFDFASRQCGGMAFLLWRTIREACREGLREFDLGRSDSGDAGLITFKDRWGGTASSLTYWSSGASRSHNAAVKWASQCARHALPHLPDRLLATVGGVLYRHFG